jgi:hypothetical protein
VTHFNYRQVEQNTPKKRDRRVADITPLNGQDEREQNQAENKQRGYRPFTLGSPFKQGMGFAIEVNRWDLQCDAHEKPAGEPQQLTAFHPGFPGQVRKRPGRWGGQPVGRIDRRGKHGNRLSRWQQVWKGDLLASRIILR